MKISIGFSKHKTGIMSPLICGLMGSKYSHVYIRRNSRYGEYVYQASGLQVNFMNIETFLEHNEIIEEYQFDLPDDSHDKVLSFCIKYAGRPYSLKELVELGIIFIVERFGFHLRFKGDGDKSLICSALGRLFCDVVLCIPVPAEQDFVTPKQLNPYVAAKGKRIL